MLKFLDVDRQDGDQILSAMGMAPWIGDSPLSCLNGPRRPTPRRHYDLKALGVHHLVQETATTECQDQVLEGHPYPERLKQRHAGGYSHPLEEGVGVDTAAVAAMVVNTVAAVGTEEISIESSLATCNHHHFAAARRMDDNRNRHWVGRGLEDDWDRQGHGMH